MNEEESNALRWIVGGSTQEFFEQIWQNECKIYRNNNEPPTLPEDTVWNEDRIQQSPLKEHVRMAWPALISLLHEARGRYQEYQEDEDTMLPILFRDQQSVSPDPYGGNLFGAYLDGCSVVLNHADWLCPYIAYLCLDLQKAFPHAYANAYLTPPDSQAVPPHADDRDVFVIQLVGQKHWKVYGTVPIPYPFPHEQVGKAGLDISPQVLTGPCLHDTVLKPGHVLYMPRGFVHEARTCDQECSFHVTIALPTHDWTLQGAVTAIARDALSQVVDYRKAMPLELFGDEEQQQSSDLAFMVEQQLEDAMARIKREVHLNSIRANLREKRERHNKRALAKRMARIHAARIPAPPTLFVVGPEAAATVTLDTVVRASTLEEKSSQPESQQPRGLHVREGTADALLGVISELKVDPSLTCQVSELLSLLKDKHELCSGQVCQLTILSFARCFVELGGLAIVR